MRIFPQPFIEGYIHGLHGSLHLEEIAFGTRSCRRYTDCQTQVIEEETVEQDNAIIQFAQGLENIPDKHSEESDQHTEDDHPFVIDDACVLRRAEDDSKARYDPRYSVEKREEESNLQYGNKESYQQEGEITDY